MHCGEDCFLATSLQLIVIALAAFYYHQYNRALMSTDTAAQKLYFPHRHLLGIKGLSAREITGLLDLADEEADFNRQIAKKRDILRGRTQVNLFFESSTRTQSSFELAGKRLGADVMNMSVKSSSIEKGETLIDTAMTLNAMRPDILIIRHSAAGAVELLARKVDCSVKSMAAMSFRQ